MRARRDEPMNLARPRCGTFERSPAPRFPGFWRRLGVPKLAQNGDTQRRTEGTPSWRGRAQQLPCQYYLQSCTNMILRAAAAPAGACRPIPRPTGREPGSFSSMASGTEASSSRPGWTVLQKRRRQDANTRSRQGGHRRSTWSSPFGMAQTTPMSLSVPESRWARRERGMPNST